MSAPHPQAIASEAAARSSLDSPRPQEREAALDALLARDGAPACHAELPQPTVPAAGPVGEAAVLDAARHGEGARVRSLLATSAHVPCAAVARAAATRSAKGLVSLAWKAGFSMRTAAAVQAVLAELGPGELIEAGPGGDFPLQPAEMEFQIGLLAT